ncbi:MAG: hypothetical protein ACPL7A_01420, partial [Anaerolineales bacterium]
VAEKTIISLPGVPREMEYLMENSVIPYIKQVYNLHGIIKNRTLHTLGIGESLVDSQIADLEQLTNPTVGLAAHSGQVDIRITVKAESEAEANKLIQPIEVEIRKRLGEYIYGADDQSLAQIALNGLREKSWHLVVCESNTSAHLTQLIQQYTDIFSAAEILQDRVSETDLAQETQLFQNYHQTECALGLAINREDGSHKITIFINTPTQKETITKFYGGPTEYAPLYAANHALDILRKI